MGGIIGERRRKKSKESTKKKTKDRELWKRAARREGGKRTGNEKKEARRGGVRRIYSRCSPFCSRNHHLCALSDAAHSFAAADVRGCCFALHRESNRFVRFCLISDIAGEEGRERKRERTERERENVHVRVLTSVIARDSVDWKCVGRIKWQISRPAFGTRDAKSRRNFLGFYHFLSATAIAN